MMVKGCIGGNLNARPDEMYISGVGDGSRTHNARNHNPVLCH